MIDLHSHILPGVDDGARSLDESVEIVRRLANFGVTDIVATPHFVNETAFMVPAAKNYEILKQLGAKLAEEGIRVNLYLGNEIYIDENIAKFLREGKILPLAGGQYLLVELPLSGKFLNYKDILLDLMQMGYKVILAHPERYATIQKNLMVAYELAQMGILFQGDLGSLVGRYGKKAQRTIRQLIKMNTIFAFGSDSHRPPRTEYLLSIQKALAKHYNERELSQVLTINPQSVLHRVANR